MLRKISSLVFAVLLCLSLFTPNAWADGYFGNFSQSCNDIKLDVSSYGDITLKAQCKDRRGIYGNTEFDLEQFISNDDGSLSWNQDDKFSNVTDTCKDISVVSSYMDAVCKKDDGSTQETTLDLDYYIGNIDGELLSANSQELSQFSGFRKSCEDIKLDVRSYGIRLEANCKKKGFSNASSYTEFDLEQFISNENGSLSWNQDGGYHHVTDTCKDISLVGSKIKALCEKDDGSTQETTLDLNNYIGNIDGNLFSKSSH